MKIKYQFYFLISKTRMPSKKIKKLKNILKKPKKKKSPKLSSEQKSQQWQNNKEEKERNDFINRLSQIIDNDETQKYPIEREIDQFIRQGIGNIRVNLYKLKYIDLHDYINNYDPKKYNVEEYLNIFIRNELDDLSESSLYKIGYHDGYFENNPIDKNNEDYMIGYNDGVDEKEGENKLDKKGLQLTEQEKRDNTLKIGYIDGFYGNDKRTDEIYQKEYDDGYEKGEQEKNKVKKVLISRNKRSRTPQKKRKIKKYDIIPQQKREQIHYKDPKIKMMKIPITKSISDYINMDIKNIPENIINLLRNTMREIISNQINKAENRLLTEQEKIDNTFKIGYNDGFYGNIEKTREKYQDEYNNGYEKGKMDRNSDSEYNENLIPISHNYSSNSLFIKELEENFYNKNDNLESYISNIVDLLIYLDNSILNSYTKILAKKIMYNLYIPEELVNLTIEHKFPEIYDNKNVDEKTKMEIKKQLDNIKKYDYNVIINKLDNVLNPTQTRRVIGGEPFINIKLFESVKPYIRDNCENSNDIEDYKLVKYEENGKTYCFDIFQLFEKFNNKNIINEYTKKNFNDEFVELIKEKYKRSKLFLPVKKRISTDKKSVKKIEYTPNFLNQIFNNLDLDMNLFLDKKNDIIIPKERFNSSTQKIDEYICSFCNKNVVGKCKKTIIYHYNTPKTIHFCEKDCMEKYTKWPNPYKKKKNVK